MRQEAEDLTDIIRNGAMLGSGGRLRGLPSSQGIVSLVILVFCGGLVIYPFVYLVAESRNVGEPDVFPPTAFGVSNYLDLIDDWYALGNTAFVACFATIIAVTIGFLSAWTLTRTNLPGRAWLERLMELPYYITPLVGALAWSIPYAADSPMMRRKRGRTPQGSCRSRVPLPPRCALPREHYREIGERQQPKRAVYRDWNIKPRPQQREPEHHPQYGLRKHHNIFDQAVTQRS